MSINEEGEREVDKEYLALLENKLKSLKDPTKIKSKTFLSDIATHKDYQLFRLLTSEPELSSGFEDNFVIDQAIVPNYIQRKIAPQTCAINKQELVKLVKSDIVDIIHREVDKLEEGENSTNPTVLADDSIIDSAEPESTVEKEKKDVKRFNRYNLSNFIPFRHSSHCLTMEAHGPSDFDSNKTVLLVGAEGNLIFISNPSNVISLSSLLPFEFPEGNFAEFVCGDVSHDFLSDGSAVLFTFWVELSRHCVPLGCYLAAFRISPSRELSLVMQKTLGSARIGHCYYSHINERGHSNKRLCICYISRENRNGIDPLLYELKENSVVVYDNIHDDALSSETFSGIPGVVIRCDIRIFDYTRWHVYGYDTGYAVVTVTNFESGTRFRKQVVKFTAPVSVTLVLHDYSAEKSHSRFVLLASTFGPLMIWKFTLENNEFVGAHVGNLELKMNYDAITCGCVMGDLVLIGTYKGIVLAYKIRNIYACSLFHEVETDSSIQFNAPVTSLRALNSDKTCVLTTEGAQILTRFIDVLKIK